MDRLVVPYRLIMISTKLDKGSRMRVRTAHGMRSDDVVPALK